MCAKHSIKVTIRELISHKKTDKVLFLLWEPIVLQSMRIYEFTTGKYNNKKEFCVGFIYQNVIKDVLSDDEVLFNRRKYNF